MNTRRTARTVGMLYILGTAAGIGSVLFLGPMRNSQNSLAYAAANGSQSILGALAILVMGLSLAMIPILMYPTLKTHNETLAVGYIVFRSALETVIYILMTINVLFLLPVSRAYTMAGDMPNQALGALLLNANDLTGPILAIVFITGALLFYSALYRSKLVPRWISVWGLIGAAPYLAMGILTLTGIVEVNSPSETICYMPIAVQELVLAVWLITKGFNPEALAVRSQAA